MSLDRTDAHTCKRIAETLSLCLWQARRGDYFAAGSAYQSALALSWKVYDTDAHVRAQSLVVAVSSVVLNLQSGGKS